MRSATSPENVERQAREQNHRRVGSWHTGQRQSGAGRTSSAALLGALYLYALTGPLAAAGRALFLMLLLMLAQIRHEPLG
jgi:hypothetical protein